MAAHVCPFIHTRSSFYAPPLWVATRLVTNKGSSSYERHPRWQLNPFSHCDSHDVPVKLHSRTAELVVGFSTAVKTVTRLIVILVDTYVHKLALLPVPQAFNKSWLGEVCPAHLQARTESRLGGCAVILYRKMGTHITFLLERLASGY